jgi:hypothetical protein
MQEKKCELFQKNQVREDTHESLIKATILSKQDTLLNLSNIFDNHRKNAYAAHKKKEKTVLSASW